MQMKTKVGSALLGGVVALAATAHAQQSASFLGGRASLSIPNALKPMSAGMLAAKYPSINRPQKAWSNPRGTISIAVSTNARARIKPSDLTRLRPALQSVLLRSKPGLKFSKNEIVSLGGARWIHYEFVSQAIDSKIYNDVYFTSVNNQLFGVTFNTTLAQKANALPLFRQAKTSLRARP